MTALLISIDPGVSGGIAWEWVSGTALLKANTPLQGVEKIGAEAASLLSQIVGLLDAYDVMPGRCYGVVEKVGPARGREDDDGNKRKQGVASTGKFCRHAGYCEMVLMARDIPMRMCAPATWQRHVGVYGKKYKSETEKKNYHKLEASRRHPGMKFTHATADARLQLDWLKHQLAREFVI